MSLNTLSKELHLTYKGAYERLKKFAEYIGSDMGIFKTEDNKIVFYKEEKEIILALLEEMGTPFMIALTSKRRTGKSPEKIYQNTIDFLSRMNPIVMRIGDEGLREGWYSLLELISKVQAEKLNIEISRKIKEIGTKITTLPYEDLIKLLSYINEGLDYWTTNHLEPQIKKLTDTNKTELNKQ